MMRAADSGKPLSGANRYTPHFARQHPPAGCWRISMYDIAGFFVNNPIGRYGLGNMLKRCSSRRV
jgi:hypothetical protein